MEQKKEEKLFDRRLVAIKWRNTLMKPYVRMVSLKYQEYFSNGLT